MLKSKTYFEQVPLKVVKKILQQQDTQEKIAPLPGDTDENDLEDQSIETRKVIHKG